MAITFDNIVSLAKCYYFNAAGNTYTSRATTESDLFTDTAAVGDMMYFGMGFHVWHDLSVNIATPLAATSITLAWEYYAGDGTPGWRALTVTDGTNSFQTAGTNTVAFAVPDAWSNYRIGTNVAYGFWIRARITAVTGLTEGGAVVASSRKCKDWAIRVTGTGNRLSDIEAADIAGSWGVVSRLNNHYQILANIWVGDGANPADLTIRNREYLELGFNSSPWDYNCRADTKYRTIQWTDYSTFQIGDLSVADINEGSTFKMWTMDTGDYNDCRGTFKMYNSTFIRMAGGYSQPAIYGPVDIQNSIWESGDGTTIYRAGGVISTGSIKNLSISVGTNTYFYFYSAGTTSIDNLMFARGKGILIGANNGLVTNCNFGTARVFTAGNSSVTATAKNCTFTNYLTQVFAGRNGNYAKVVYTLSLTILDKEGAAIASPSVKIVDSQGTTLFDGAWSADLDVLVYQQYQISAGNAPRTTYTPLDITISAPGYQTYKTVLTLTNLNRSQTISLQPALGYAYS